MQLKYPFTIDVLLVLFALPGMDLYQVAIICGSA
jgi:hypothetical protein